MKIALLTERRYIGRPVVAGEWYYGNILQDDGLLQSALLDRGIYGVRVDWSDPQVDWDAFDAAVFRTTWDYFDRFDRFQVWFEAMRSRLPMINVAETIAWNLDKRYLADLEQRGVAIVPTRFIPAGDTGTLRAWWQEVGWARAVVKPTISGGARHTYRLDGRDVDEVAGWIAAHRREHEFMLQPFLETVEERGELSLMVFAGEYSHAVRKIPKAGDFRVQDDHGGTVHPHEATAEEIAFAERVVAACDPIPVYARVDIVWNAQGGMELMELELIEPELWLRKHPPSAVAYAEAIRRALEPS